MYKSIKFLNSEKLSLRNFVLNKAMREIYTRETFVSLEYESIKFLKAKFRHKTQWNLSKPDNYPKPKGLWQNRSAG